MINRDIIKKARANQPLIHHLINQVVMNFSANGLLAFGGQPIMAKAEEEVWEMASQANGVLINIGTLTKPELRAMIAAGKAANKKGIPVVLDPVGVAATSFRTEAVKQILTEVKPTVLKGNAGEIASLVQIPWETKGVESIGDGNPEEAAVQAAELYQTTVIVTGETDIIVSGNETTRNHTGHPLLANITGSGCLLGSIIAACLTTDDPMMEQVQTAVAFYGLAAEYAAANSKVNKSGTLLPHFIDALSLDPAEMERS